MFEPDTVKGFPEFMPPESQKIEAVKNIVEKHFKLYGFLPIKTPTIEFDELIRSDALGTEDEAVSDRFRLQDKGGRNLSLRYEFTFQLARIFKRHQNIKLPFKRYQIGSVFRDEPTASQRYREFTQADADIIGDSTIEADAECIALGHNILKELKIPSKIEVNNRKLAIGILDSVQISAKHEVLKELDKIDKLGEDAVKSNLKKYADANQVLTLFKMFEKKLEFFVKHLFEGAEDLFRLWELAKHYGITLAFNPFLIRGFSYYTGNIFELKALDSKQSLGGGGRYDKAVGKYLNREVPAVGISFGLERLAECATTKIETPQVIIVSFDQTQEAIKLVQKLRKAAISSQWSSEKPSKVLEFANAYSLPYVVFLGSEEIKKKKFKLRNMKTGEEKYLSATQLIGVLISK